MKEHPTRVCLLALVCLLFSCLAAWPQDPQKNHITHGPILGRLSTSGVGIWARTGDPGTLVVLYGTSPDTALDLIVVDLHMPHIDGLHVVAALRGAEWRVPVLVVTADTRPDVGTMARRMGARAVLQKPFDLDDFRTAAMFYSRCA